MEEIWIDEVMGEVSAREMDAAEEKDVRFVRSSSLDELSHPNLSDFETRARPGAAIACEKQEEALSPLRTTIQYYTCWQKIIDAY